MLHLLNMPQSRNYATTHRVAGQSFMQGFRNQRREDAEFCASSVFNPQAITQKTIMKKILLFLLLFVSAQSFAQKQASIVFDFTNPTGLTPSVTPMPENAQTVIVTDSVFKNGPIQISFARATSDAPTTEIVTFVNPYTNEKTYYLKVGAGCDMTFKADNGVTLDSWTASEDGEKGGLHLKPGQPGYWDQTVPYLSWNKDGVDTITTLAMNCNGSSAKIHRLTINYTTPSNILKPVANIDSGEVLPQFSAIRLTFGKAMKVSSTKDIVVKSKDGKQSWNLATAIDAKDNKVVVLSLAEAITANGDYTITVPARSFTDADGYQNAALSYNFTVKAPQDVFNPVSIDPAQGEVEKMSGTFRLTFADVIGHASSDRLKITKNGTDWRPMKAVIDANDPKVLVLTVENNQGKEITEAGTYAINIPAKYVHNVFYDETGKDESDNWNADTTLVYTIPEGGIDTPTMKAAKALLENKGVGYPSETSAARTALKNLTTVLPKPSDDKLTAAMADFYKEADITLPATDKYYQVYGVNAEGKKLYLAEADGAVKLTADSLQAVAFKAKANGDNTTTLVTTEGKYLHVLVASDTYEGTTGKNVTDAYNKDVNNLKLAKLALNDVEPEKTFGLVTVYGSLGKDKVNHNAVSAYALIGYDNNEILTDSRYGVMFTADNSSAFFFKEVAKPAGKPISVEAELSPSTVTTLSLPMTLTFKDIDAIKLVDAKKPYFAAEDGTKTSASLTADKGNAFKVALGSDFKEGKYQLVLPEGTFTCTKGDDEYAVKADTLGFVIDMSAETVGFKYDYTSLSRKVNGKDLTSSEMPVKDVWLNDFVYWIYKSDIQGSIYTGLVPDQTKTVKLAYYNNGNVVRTGHFEPTTVDEPSSAAIKVVWDTPIKEGELRKGQYALQVWKATYGDANFGKYLNGDASVKPEDCHVNPGGANGIDFYVITFNVDNNAATSIDITTNEANAPKVIYDIAGRKVQNMDKPGLYIVNGKKVVKK